MTAPVRTLPSRDGTTRIRDTSAQDTVRRKPGTRRLVPWFLGVAALLIIAAALIAGRGWWQAQSAVRADRLQFAVVQKGSFSRQVQAQGRVIAAVSPQVYAEAAGTVTLRVKAGDLVKAGDVVAQIKSPELTSRLGQEQA
ncbi:MAG: biotin/lipoyl-binding protein, partial [Pseudomonadota bacterium]